MALRADASSLLELRIDLHLVSGDHLVGLIRHADNRHQLVEHGVGHALLLRAKPYATRCSSGTGWSR